MLSCRVSQRNDSCGIKYGRKGGQQKGRDGGASQRKQDQSQGWAETQDADPSPASHTLEPENAHSSRSTSRSLAGQQRTTALPPGLPLVWISRRPLPTFFPKPLKHLPAGFSQPDYLYQLREALRSFHATGLHRTAQEPRPPHLISW